MDIFFLSDANICIVSGAAMGVDSLAHQGAKPHNTIAVVANGLDIKYPSINKNLITDIEKNGLMLSAYKEGEKARNYTFVLRNEIVVALGDLLIVTQADINSGTLTSVDYALKMGKKVYTIPHRLNDSLGTQNLLQKGLIEAIYDIDKFIEEICGIKINSSKNDEVLADAFENLKSHYKFVGVLTIIMISLYVLLIGFSLVAGSLV